MVVATDAPLSDRNLQRLAARAIMGLAHTGSSASNGSGDYVIAFSTSPLVRRHFGPGGVPLTDSTGTGVPGTRTTAELTNDDMSALFQGVVEATEEAIYDSLTTATTVTAREGTAEALPIPKLLEVLKKYGVVK
jgi:D-aminopeptidase